MKPKFLSTLAVALFGMTSALVANTQQAKTSFWFIEANPTYMDYSISSNDDGAYDNFFTKNDGYYNLKMDGKFYGANLAFGRQINKWHKVQIDVGYLRSNSVKWKEDGLVYLSPTFPVPYNPPGEKTESSVSFYSALVTYNFTFPLFNNRLVIGVGPSVGYSHIDLEAHKPEYEGGGEILGKENGFTYGGGINVQWNFSKRFYVNAGYKYLVVSEGIGNAKTSNFGVGVGFKL